MQNIPSVDIQSGYISTIVVNIFGGPDVSFCFKRQSEILHYRIKHGIELYIDIKNVIEKRI